jgi:hypothetical protein
VVARSIAVCDSEGEARGCQHEGGGEVVLPWGRGNQRDGRGIPGIQNSPRGTSRA